MEVVMPKHKNKAAAPNPDSQPPLIKRYLFPVTIGILLLAVVGIGWFLLSSTPTPLKPAPVSTPTCLLYTSDAADE